MTNLLTLTNISSYATGLMPACITTTRASLKPSLNLRRQPILFSGEASSIRTDSRRRKRAAAKFVTRAGPPSANTYIFAFVFPLSLLAVTIFTSIRIADKLDKDFVEELAILEAMKEAEEEEDGVVEAPPAEQTLTLEEPALPKTRNRPKREA